MNPKKDYYAVLGVEPTASAEELRSAWRALIEQHHPDRWTPQGKERLVQATRRTQEINEAWQALNEASRRLQYDRQRTLHLLQMVTWRPPRPRPADVLDIDDLRTMGISPNRHRPPRRHLRRRRRLPRLPLRGHALRAVALASSGSGTCGCPASCVCTLGGGDDSNRPGRSA